MRFVKNLETFLENQIVKETGDKGNTNLITDICVAMLLINPSFLDNILDRGLRGRYLHDTSVFLNDLKNMVLSKNRLKLGIKQDKKYVEDDNIGKINTYFNEYSKDFDMEKDWSKLNKVREISRTIQDKLLQEEKLEPNQIKCVYWISPNKEKGEKADLVLETINGYQYSLVINSRLVTNKTQSFNTLLDILVDKKADLLFTEPYLERWDKLTQEWFKLVYNNVKNNYKLMIDDFIDATRADSLTYFEYYDIQIQDEKHKHLGKFYGELGRNHLNLSSLMSDIYKKGIDAFDNFDKIKKEWEDLKSIIMNSKIIEHLIINSLDELIENDSVEKTTDNYYIATDKVKMKLLKLLVSLMSVEDLDIYYASKDKLHHVPSRRWFRDNYDSLNVFYDYHKRLNKDENDSDSQFRIKVHKNNRPLLEMELFTGFSGGEMSGKLNTKMKVNYEPDFNYKIV